MKGSKHFRALSLMDLYFVLAPAQNSVRFACLNSDQREELVEMSINDSLSEIDNLVAICLLKKSLIKGILNPVLFTFLLREVLSEPTLAPTYPWGTRPVSFRTSQIYPDMCYTDSKSESIQNIWIRSHTQS